MSQPPPYNRFRDYSEYQASHQLPGPALSGSDLDAEFDRIKTTTDAALANLAQIQRDDGKLRNFTVHPDALSTSTRALIGGWNPRGPWITATNYNIKDMISVDNFSYVCVTAHTSSTFSTDYVAGKWMPVSLGETAVASVPTLAGLRGLLTRNEIVQTSGRVTEGDGDDASYRWFAGDTTPDDNADVISPTAGPPGRYKRLQKADVQYVDTMADLSGLKSRPSVVFVRGFWSVGDGGHGWFGLYPGSTTTPVVGMIVSPNVGPACRYKRFHDDFVNLLWFGAKGDNITDNTAAWNACQAYCHPANRTMYVPAGYYAIFDSPDTITAAMHIRGDGEWCTFFIQKGVNKNGIFFDLNYATGGGVDGISIHAFSSNPGETKSTGFGMRVQRANGSFWARNYDINGFAVGLRETANFYTFFTDFQILNASVAAIHSAGRAGIGAQDGAGVWFCNAKLSNFGTLSNNTGSVGILIESAAGNHYEGLDATCFAEGIKLKPSTGYYIAHLFFDRVLADTSVIDGWVLDSSNGTITNVQCDGCWSGFNTNGYGVKITGSTYALDDVRWIGGSIRENGQYGVYANWGNNLRFSDVSIAKNSKLTTLTYSGVFLTGAGLGSITFNACTIGNFSSSAAWSQLHGIYIDVSVAGRVRVLNSEFVSTGAGGVELSINSTTADVTAKDNWPRQSNIDLVGGEIVRGVTNGSVTAGTTTYLGIHGAVSTEANAQYVSGSKRNIRRIFFAAGPPGIGENYTYTVRKNGIDTAMTCVSSGDGSFAASATGDIDLDVNDSFSVKLVTSAGATATDHRWSIEMSG